MKTNIDIDKYYHGITADLNSEDLIETGYYSSYIKPTMKYLYLGVLFFIMALLGISCNNMNRNNKKTNYDALMIRIAEIEIDAVYLEAYISILKDESEASVRLEPGVICIYPMFEKDNPTQIRLLEVYASKADYESHLQTSHFKHYKTSTLKMVKSLKLIEMDAIDPQTMSNIFTKIRP